MEKLNIKTPVNLVGTSQGGSIALYFAANHPEKIKKLALLSPFINILPMKAIIALIKIPGIGEYLGSVLLDRINTNYPKKVFANPNAIPVKYTENYKTQLTYKGFKRARISNLRGDSLTDFTPQYEAVAKTKIPVLLTWGT